MKNFEMVEKLREKANVTYEEAKAALELNDWDLLDAMVYLEKEGKMDYEWTSEFSTKEEKESKKQESKAKAAGGINKFFSAVKDLASKGLNRHFEIRFNEESVIRIPLTILVILLLFMWAAIPFFIFVAIVAYIFGVRYKFTTNGVTVSKPKDDEEGDSNSDQNTSETEAR